MRRGGLGGLLLVLLLFSSAWCYTFLDLGIGSEVSPASARCLGMGEVGLLCETDALTVAVNPATLAMLKRPEVTVSYGFLALNDEWSFPAYDSFDAVLGYTTYSKNSNIYHTGSLGLATGALEQAGGLCFAFALGPAFDYTYDFHEEVRDRSSQSVPADKVIADSYVESEGDLKAATLGMAGMVGPVALGASLDYLTGDYEIRSRLTHVDTTKIRWDVAKTETDDTYKASNLDGIRFRMGARYALTERVEMAAVMTTGFTAEGEYTAETDDGLLSFLPLAGGEGGSFEIEYPGSYCFGISFRPRNQLLTVIEGNVKYVRWSDVSNGAFTDLNLDDTVEWRIGVEHVFYNDRPMRFGFVYKPSPADEDASEAAVTFGSGLVLSGFGIEFAGRIGWKEYRYFDLVDDSVFGTGSREFTDLVEETAFGGMITVSRRF